MMTKAELIKENERLNKVSFELTRTITKEKENVKRQLRQLGCMMGNNVDDWGTLCYLVGELKADADFSVTVEARDELKRENSVLKEEIRKFYLKEVE